MNDRRRRRTDRLFGGVVRVASLTVLLAVAGVLIQMVTVARPLLFSQGAERPAGPTRLDTSVAETSRDWLPEGLRWVYGAERAGQRLWFGLDHSGQVQGARGVQGANELPSMADWSYESLRLDQRMLTDTIVGITVSPDWRHLALLTPVQRLWLLPTDGGPAQILPWSEATADGVATLAGERSFVTWRRAQLTQWHWIVAGAKSQRRPARLRGREFAAPIRDIVPAPTHQRVAVMTADDKVSIWHSTSDQLIAVLENVPEGTTVQWFSGTHLVLHTLPPRHVEIPDSDAAVSLTTLLQPVHYETYAAPMHRWLPATGTALEPKFGLMPLLWGTMKAALVALTIALPIGVGAATFVGFFLSPRMRDRIKPLLELLSAFPSVVLGALTALVVAPHFLTLLPGLAGATVLIPTGVLTGALIWRGTGAIGHGRRGVGWLPLLLLPLILILGAAGFLLGQILSTQLPGGDWVRWFEQSLGIAVVHRNALLVGCAMGVAVVPLVFTIAEEAIHTVPAKFAAGSLALGATHWQSYRDVVFPIAIPGIVAAGMIGLGRAIGETMIVLLVASHTPLMEVNLLEGLRTVSATLALELSEAPFESVHYRVLFAAGLALFALTFVLNSLAEYLRLRSQRQWLERV